MYARALIINNIEIILEERVITSGNQTKVKIYWLEVGTWWALILRTKINICIADSEK